MSVVRIEFVSSRSDLPPEWIDLTLSTGRVLRYCKEAANRPLERREDAGLPPTSQEGE